MPGRNMIYAGGLQIFNASMDSPAGALRSPAGRPVIDKTGIQGKYDFTLKYARDSDTASAQPSLFTALEEQFGLKLESQKISIEVLVVDQAEKIPANNRRCPRPLVSRRRSQIAGGTTRWYHCVLAMFRKLLISAGFCCALIVTAGSLAYLTNGAPAVPYVPAGQPDAKPYVVKLHAKWCYICVYTRDVWSRIEKEYSGRVNLVVLDFTDEESTKRSRAEAARLGFTEFFEEYAGVSGFIVVLDGRTKKMTAEILGRGDYRSAIDAALGKTGAEKPI